MLQDKPSHSLFHRDRQPGWRTCAFFCLVAISLFLIGLIPTWGIASAKAPVQTSAAVLTYKDDLTRSGANTQETLLNTQTVKAQSFGKRMTYPVDGRVYAQPLFVPNIHVDGAVHNVVFVATEHDSVYAFDADNIANQTPLWQTSFLSSPNVTPVPQSDVSCDDIGGPDVGITSTPVIDLKANTLYVVAATKENGHYFSRLHALDIATGTERPHSPVTISATYPVNGQSNSTKKITFDAQRQDQRAALLLLNNTVYIAWGSYCDMPPYYGWLMGYSTQTMKQVSVFVPTPDQIEGGLWQSGAGPVADSQGNIYMETGDGNFNLDSKGVDAGDTVLKLSTQHGLHVVDYFTPFDQLCMHWFNLDLGSAGPLLLPDTHELIASGKEGRIYVLNSNKLGGYHTIPDPCHQLKLTNVDQITQELPPNTANGGIFGSLAYWHSPSGDYIYVSGLKDTHLKAFKVTNGLLSQTPTSESPTVTDAHGHAMVMTGEPAVSSDGQKPGTAIVWLIDQHGVLRAFDATNLAHELYNSNINASRDSLGTAVKFSVPTVANGEVFVGTTNSLVIYGLLV